MPVQGIKIPVEFTLDLESLKQAISRGAEMIREGVATRVGVTGGSGVSNASTQQPAPGQPVKPTPISASSIPQGTYMVPPGGTFGQPAIGPAAAQPRVVSSSQKPISQTPKGAFSGQNARDSLNYSKVDVPVSSSFTGATGYFTAASVAKNTIPGRLYASENFVRGGTLARNAALQEVASTYYKLSEALSTSPKESERRESKTYKTLGDIFQTSFNTEHARFLERGKVSSARLSGYPESFQNMIRSRAEAIAQKTGVLPDVAISSALRNYRYELSDMGRSADIKRKLSQHTEEERATITNRARSLQESGLKQNDAMTQAIRELSASMKDFRKFTITSEKLFQRLSSLPQDYQARFGSEVSSTMKKLKLTESEAQSLVISNFEKDFSRKKAAERGSIDSRMMYAKMESGFAGFGSRSQQYIEREAASLYRQYGIPFSNAMQLAMSKEKGLQKTTAKGAWRKSLGEFRANFFGPPNPMGIFMNSLFGGWEVATAVAGSSMASAQMAGVKTSSDYYDVLSQRMQAITAGPFGSIGGLLSGAHNDISILQRGSIIDKENEGFRQRDLSRKQSKLRMEMTPVSEIAKIEQERKNLSLTEQFEQKDIQSEYSSKLSAAQSLEKTTISRIAGFARSVDREKDGFFKWALGKSLAPASWFFGGFSNLDNAKDIKTTAESLKSSKEKELKERMEAARKELERKQAIAESRAFSEIEFSREEAAIFDNIESNPKFSENYEAKALERKQKLESQILRRTLEISGEDPEKSMEYKTLLARQKAETAQFNYTQRFERNRLQKESDYLSSFIGKGGYYDLLKQGRAKEAEQNQLRLEYESELAGISHTDSFRKEKIEMLNKKYEAKKEQIAFRDYMANRSFRAQMRAYGSMASDGYLGSISRGNFYEAQKMEMEISKQLELSTLDLTDPNYLNNKRLVEEKYRTNLGVMEAQRKYKASEISANQAINQQMIDYSMSMMKRGNVADPTVMSAFSLLGSARSRIKELAGEGFLEQAKVEGKQALQNLEMMKLGVGSSFVAQQASGFGMSYASSKNASPQDIVNKLDEIKSQLSSMISEIIKG
ncbi:MAG: hypothetical protein KatS3mg104_3049 [Phycisphaerae bacterium]|nr:MAG: hypothetical protein KatS3mg104_3049 [Phycisphaerae bacterium]